MKSFNPEAYDEDITLVEMQSMGRGRGFKVVGEYSALGDEAITSRIASRLHQLLHLIEGDSPIPLQVKNVQLEDQVEELEDDVKALQSELEAARVRISAFEEEAETHDALLTMVNEALGDAYDEEFTDLGSAVGVMIKGYDDLREEVEDEG